MTGATRRTVLAGAAALAARGSRAAAAPLRIGVLTDLAGPYAAIAGPGSVACARQALREWGASGGAPVELLVADHHNDAAEGARIARAWCREQGVALIVDVPNTDVALAVADVARAENRAYVNTGAATMRMTEDGCAPITVHWSFDTAMLTASTGGAVVRAGGATWFFVSADYAFGRELEAAMGHAVLAAGGRLVGSARTPFPGPADFAPIMAEAAGSGAGVLGLALAGADVVAGVRAARRADIGEQMRIACLLLQIADVHALGPAVAGGLWLTESFYWDLNERTRAFTARLLAADPAAPHPTMIQAGTYAGTLHFLKAAAAIGIERARDGAAVVARMKAMPTDDDAFGPARIRADGRAMLAAVLFQVKTPAESVGEWDLYRQVSALPAEAMAPPAAICHRR